MIKTEINKSRLKESILQLKKIVLLLFIISICITANAQSGKLYIGTATADILPALPVALNGQFYLRIAHTAATPLTANVVALESRLGDRSLDMAIMVSCDLPGMITYGNRNFSTNQIIAIINVSIQFIRACLNFMGFHFRVKWPVGPPARAAISRLVSPPTATEARFLSLNRIIGEKYFH